MYCNIQVLIITGIYSLLGFSQKAETLIPLSPTGYAFKRGNPASNVVVEFFIDLGCSSCLNAWPTLNKVVETYKNDVNFLYRIFPLPYHQQAFILSKGASLVDYYSPSSDAVFTYIDTCYNNQALIYNSATSDMTYNQVVSLVGTWATNGTGVNMNQYIEGMDSSTTAGNAIEFNSRYMFKYSSLHDVWATPVYQINGEIVLGIDTFETWSETLDSLLTITK